MSNDIGYAVNVIRTDTKRYAQDMVALLKASEVNTPAQTSQPSTQPAAPANSGKAVDQTA